MTASTGDPLEQLIRETGHGLLLDWRGEPAQSLESLHATLAAVKAMAAERLGSEAPDITAEALAADYEANPHRVKAFLQALWSSRSPEMLLMAWRVMQGLGIEEVTLAYRSEQSFELRVVLAPPDAEGAETYQSTDVNDLALIRHFGITTLSDRPLLDGFYPLQL